MEVKDWITSITVLIAVIGWFINAILNRSHEISKERFKYQMTARHSFIEVWLFIQKNSAPFSDARFLPLLEKARKEFHLYGANEEISLIEEFIKAAEGQNLVSANEILGKLVNTTREKIRKELSIR